jgi:hypothetical protein
LLWYQQAVYLSFTPDPCPLPSWTLPTQANMKEWKSTKSTCVITGKRLSKIMGPYFETIKYNQQK